MTWDHLPGRAKVGDISSLRRFSKRAVMVEIEKCELVCANCHAVRSYERRRGVAQPGQSAAFGTQRFAGSNPAAPTPLLRVDPLIGRVENPTLFPTVEVTWLIGGCPGPTSRVATATQGVPAIS